MRRAAAAAAAGRSGAAAVPPRVRPPVGPESGAGGGSPGQLVGAGRGVLERPAGAGAGGDWRPGRAREGAGLWGPLGAEHMPRRATRLAAADAAACGGARFAGARAREQLRGHLPEPQQHLRQLRQRLRQLRRHFRQRGWHLRQLRRHLRQRRRHLGQLRRHLRQRRRQLRRQVRQGRGASVLGPGDDSRPRNRRGRGGGRGGPRPPLAACQNRHLELERTHPGLCLKLRGRSDDAWRLAVRSPPQLGRWAEQLGGGAWAGAHAFALGG
mmetsp:Transcript_28084/g.61882  ORF Transcript_28084/g.61882 Transcript_28084/m.61882 type:complete len:269 (+) Transcript_28084:85-891(+)